MGVSAEKISARERIIDAAVQVFGEQGFKGATTREIAKVADVNETTLFRNFQNKEALFKEVVERAASRMTELIATLGMSGKDLREDLSYFAEMYSRVIEENEPMVRMLVGEAKRQPEEAQLIAHNAWSPVKQRLNEFVKHAQQSGKIRHDIDVEQALTAFSGAIFAYVLRRCMIPHAYTKEDFLKTTIDIFIRGLMPDPKEG
jgi:AcrR family transcriptional regulator